MIESVRNYLIGFGDCEERILQAMDKIDRRDFLPEEDKTSAYVDGALSIGYRQTISQPSTVARMLSLLKLNENDNVLEVGTGSGWNACLLGFIVKWGKVTSTEVFDELVVRAKKKISDAGLKNVEILVEDFRLLNKKFDKIIFTAGIDLSQGKIIVDFAEGHLMEGGILICPYQEGPLMILRKSNGKIEKSYTRESYGFVKLNLS